MKKTLQVAGMLLAAHPFVQSSASAQCALNILWDDAHDSDGDELSGSYSSFATLATSAGHTLTELDGAPGALTPAALSGQDVVALMDGELAFTGAEIASLQDFVDAGGLLFVIGENPGAFARTSHNVLLAPYGVEFNTATSSDLVNFTADPLTTGVSFVKFASGGAGVLSGPGTKALGTDADGRLGLASAADGAVVLLGDSNAIDNIRLGQSNDNQQLVSNIFAHLCAHLVIQVDVDIKPESDVNPLNPDSSGKIPVAILSTSDFDATTVDASTVRFGATGTEAAPTQWALEDVDADGGTDMILHFNTQDTGIACGDEEASLTGETTSGRAISGVDVVTLRACL